MPVIIQCEKWKVGKVLVGPPIKCHGFKLHCLFPIIIASIYDSPKPHYILLPPQQLSHRMSYYHFSPPDIVDSLAPVKISQQPASGLPPSSEP